MMLTLLERSTRIIQYHNGLSNEAGVCDAYLICRSEPETESFGIRLSDVLEPGDVIALTGDLGAGKTALTKAIAKGLGVKETVTSPTFTIVKEYRSGRLPLYHFDVYRFGELPDPDMAVDALFDIGGEEYLYGKGVCVIEWADLVRDAIPENALWISVEYGDEDSERVYKLASGGAE